MIGKTLEHYQTTSQLDISGIGEAFQAKDPKLLLDLTITSAE
jgi:hypothetical protein